MRSIRWKWLLLAVVVDASVALVGAKPFTPASDTEVLEQLPERSSPMLADLKRRRALLERVPNDERIAVAFARKAIDASRATGDPRYLGQAQAALGPWWELPEPGSELLLLRATIRQSLHAFSAALADLDRLLASEPEHRQARLTRASVLTVHGRYAEARADCARLAGRALELVVAACTASAEHAAGSDAGTYRRLVASLSQPPRDGALRAWAETLAGEIAAATGEPRLAEGHFRAALAANPADTYARAAWADFLLDAGRPDEVVALLGADTRNDALLLRLALAEKEVPGRRSAHLLHAGWLADRFAAARLRGDETHLREEARYAHAIEGDPQRAVVLARRNFELQREAADVRLLITTARAAGDDAALALARDWIRKHDGGRRSGRDERGTT